MSFHGDTTLIEKRHGAYVQFTRNILLGIAYCLEWFTKFILYFALHLVDVLEALTGVLLQVLRVVKLAIKVLFTFGVLLQFVGRSFGAVGSFLFVLSLFTYFCFWRPDSSFVSAISGALHINVCIVSLFFWFLTIPIGGLLVFVRLRRKINQQIDLLVNYDEFYENAEYVDKSTETATVLAPRLEAPGAGVQGITREELFADKGTEIETEPLEYPGAELQLFPSKDPFASVSASVLTQQKDSPSSEGTERDEEEKRKEKKSAPKATSRRRGIKLN